MPEVVDDAGGIHFEVDAGLLVEEGVCEWEWDHRLDSVESADETDMGGGHAERTEKITGLAIYSTMLFRMEIDGALTVSLSNGWSSGPSNVS